MMDSYKRFINRQLLKVDMGIFFWIMSIFRAGIIVIDVCLNLLFGFTIQFGTRKEYNKIKEYQHSAQVVNLLGRGAYSLIQPQQLNNFVWRHEQYVHPKYVIEHDNITLMGVTPKQVFFCISDSDIDVYDTKVTPADLPSSVCNTIISTDCTIHVHEPVLERQEARHHATFLLQQTWRGGW